MKVFLYTWQSLPAKYKGYAPYTKHFFDNGGKVTMALVAIGFDKGTGRTELALMLSHMATPPTDEISAIRPDDLTRLCFWTLEKKSSGDSARVRTRTFPVPVSARKKKPVRKKPPKKRRRKKRGVEMISADLSGPVFGPSGGGTYYNYSPYSRVGGYGGYALGGPVV
jgi:hypothetical protein